MTAELAAKANALRALHHTPSALVLPNAWDAASARLIASAGFAAIGTSSGAIAQALGHDDNDSMPVDDAFDAIARVVRAAEVPVSADIEAGYRLAPSELVQRLLEAGAVGYNIEDTDHSGDEPLVDAEAHAERLAGLKSQAARSGVDLVLNARVDVFRHTDVTSRSLDESIRRGLLYVEAGADVIFPIRLGDASAIGQLVAAIPVPINILLRPDTPPLARLVELGVRRISVGGGIFRAAYTAAHQAVAALADQLDGPA